MSISTPPAPQRHPHPMVAADAAPSPAMGLWRVDRATGSAWWSPGMYDLLGLDPVDGPLAPSAWQGLVHPHDRPEVDDAWRRASDGATGVSVRFRVLRPDGSTRWLVGWVDEALPGDDGRAALAGCLHDATAHEAAYERLRASEERLRRTVEGVDGILVHEEPGDEPLRFSGQVERILGYPADAFRRFDDWNAIVHPEDLPRCRETWDAEPETWALEYRVRRADGRWIWVRDRGRRTPAAGDRPGGVFSMITDVDELHALAERSMQLERLEATGGLAAGLAHHFNNILAAVDGWIELARAETSREEVRADLDAALEAAQRATRLVAELRAYGRRERLMPGAVDIADVVRAFAPTMRTLLPASIEVALIEAGGPAALVEFDRALLERILANLAVNSADAMPAGGRVTVTTRIVHRHRVPMRDGLDLAPGRYGRIEVSDTGHGMDAATLARVFEPFFSTKGPTHGTGMGLPASYGLVRQAGGTIELSSTLGAGTTVVIDLPTAS